MLPLSLAGELEKAVVGPDNIVALRPENNHGQGRVDHGVLGGGIHRTGDTVQIFSDLPTPAAAVFPVIQAKAQDNDQLCHRQGDGIEGGQQGEDDQTDEVELQPGLKQLGDLTVQKRFLLPGNAPPASRRGGAIKTRSLQNEVNKDILL